MEKKKDIKGILLVVFIVISLLLTSFIVYDKFLKKETCSCPKEDCKCEKNDSNSTEKIDSNSEEKSILSSKYINENDKNSYITFDVTNNSWSSVRNVCEGYEELHGSYAIENNKLRLLSDNFTDKNSSNYGANVVFELVSDSSGHVEKMKDLIENDFYFSGCMGSDYFIAEK